MQIHKTIQEIQQLAQSSTEMKGFLKNQTNITAILGGNTHTPHEFSRCHYSQLFKIVRANGDLRPCFIRVMEPSFILGNILQDNLETIALKTLYINSKKEFQCDSLNCLQCHVNYTLEQGLLNNMKLPNSLKKKEDFMF